jgi:hypothetical protein
MLVPEGGDDGADEELQHVFVAQGLDPSPEGPKANLASEGKPRIINPYFKIMPTVGDSHKGPLKNWGKLISFRKKRKRKQIRKPKTRAT